MSTAASRDLAAAPVDGGLYLQVCGECATVQYPPRERCMNCLSDALQLRAVDGAATVLASTALHHSLEPRFAARLPWPVASLKLDAGPVVFAHLGVHEAAPGRRLQVANARDADERWCLVAFEPAGHDAATALHQTLHTLGMET